jgi:hypothetical protein
MKHQPKKLVCNYCNKKITPGEKVNLVRISEKNRMYFKYPTDISRLEKHFFVHFACYKYFFNLFSDKRKRSIYSNSNDGILSFFMNMFFFMILLIPSAVILLEFVTSEEKFGGNGSKMVINFIFLLFLVVFLGIISLIVFIRSSRIILLLKKYKLMKFGFNFKIFSLATILMLFGGISGYFNFLSWKISSNINFFGFLLLSIGYIKTIIDIYRNKEDLELMDRK